MATKQRTPLGKRQGGADATKTLVEARRRTLTLTAVGPQTDLAVKLLGLDGSGNTTFEELACVGLTPSLDQLAAVVLLNTNAGYSGPLCGAGSTEHVRFYVSHDDGASWTDAGADSFAVYDTPGPRPLHHAVNLIAPMRKPFCWIRNHPTVRAILSWNVPPPPGQPDWVPVWGDVRTVRVRPRSRVFPVLGDLIDVGAVQISADLSHLIAPHTPVQLLPQPTPSVAELAKEYRRAKVEPLRIAFPAYLSAQTTGAFAEPAVGRQRLGLTPAPEGDLPPGPFPPDPFPPDPFPPAPPVPAPPDGPFISPFELVLADLDLDLSQWLDLIASTDGNTSYEELGCVGYDPVQDALTAVFTIKRPNGYSGQPCTGGSTEFVAFWVDWGSGWEHVGTTSTTVHDEDVPDEGLQFAVYHPLGSYPHRKHCAEGPVQPRVRAILSWQQSPPPGNPDWVPVWGNREEGDVELPKGAVTPLMPVLESVSGYALCQVNPITGLTHAHDRPFGATLRVAGFIPGAPDLASPPMQYRVTAHQLNGAGTVVASEVLAQDFTAWVTESVGGGSPVQYSVLQQADADGWFDYLADPNPGGTGWRQVLGNLLYPWNSQPRTGRWEIELRARTAGGTEYAAQVITCTDGTARQRARVRLDQAVPGVDLQILTYHLPGQPDVLAGTCMKFPVGAVLEGTFAATDEHFDTVSFGVEGAPFSGTTPSGNPRWTITGATAYPAAATTGTSGTWAFDTEGMQACGYVMRLVARDRTVNGSGGWWDDDVFGFSLE